MAIIFKKWFQGKSGRRDKIRTKGFDLGFEFDERDDYGTLNLLKDFDLFRRGQRRKMYNVLTQKGPNLDESKLFDYRYTISTGKSSQTFRQTVLFIYSKELNFPIYKMQPEQFFHRLGEKIGLIKDIDFVDYPVFSKNYLLQSEDEWYLRKRFSDKLIQYLTRHSGWHIEGINYYMVLYKANRLIQPDSYGAFWDHGKKICDLFHEPGT